MISADGSIRYDGSRDAAVEWSTVEAFAQDYWRALRLTGRVAEADPMHADFCLKDAVGQPAHREVPTVLDAIVDAARDDELDYVGTGPVEDLVSAVGDGPAVVDGLERRARQDPRWRAVIAGVWLDRDGDPKLYRRLARFGATFANGNAPSC